MATVVSKKQPTPSTQDDTGEVVAQPIEVTPEVVQPIEVTPEVVQPIEVVQPEPVAQATLPPEIAQVATVPPEPVAPEPARPKPPIISQHDGKPTPAEALMAQADADWEIVTEAAKTNLDIELFTGTLNGYEKIVRVGQVIDEAAGARANLALMNRILSITTLPKETFEKMWGILLLFAFRNSARGKVFAPTSINRFMQMWRIPQQEATYLSLMNLIITTANPATRKKNFAFVDFTNRSWRGVSEEAKAKIHHFYAK